MAQTVRIHLEGGPCNGRNATVHRDGDLLPGFKCSGVDYQPTSHVTKQGRVVYTTKESQAPPPINKPGHHATGAWHRLMKASLHDLPHSVQRSQENIRAIRRIVRSH